MSGEHREPAERGECLRTPPDRRQRWLSGLDRPCVAPTGGVRGTGDLRSAVDPADDERQAEPVDVVDQLVGRLAAGVAVADRHAVGAPGCSRHVVIASPRGSGDTVDPPHVVVLGEAGQRHTQHELLLLVGGVEADRLAVLVVLGDAVERQDELHGRTVAEVQHAQAGVLLGGERLRLRTCGDAGDADAGGRHGDAGVLNLRHDLGTPGFSKRRGLRPGWD